jgi:hypothetical protein
MGDSLLPKCFPVTQVTVKMSPEDICQPTRVSSAILDKCDRMLHSRNERQRWQAAIVLGEFADTDPAMIWPLVVKHGSRRHADVRMAIATCVLEHVLEHHFETYFPKVEKEALANRWFADTFASCYAMGEAEFPANQQRWRRLKNQFRPLAISS